MPRQTIIKKNFKGLMQLKNMLEHNLEARVGILGANAVTPREVEENTEELSEIYLRYREEYGIPMLPKQLALTNSDIGFKNEFGVKSQNIPKRSFLREPIQEKFKGEVLKNKAYLKRLFSKMKIKEVFKGIGAIAEGIVQEAFATRGFGKWAPNAEDTILQKGSDSPLIDTSQLRKSISSDVKEK